MTNFQLKDTSGAFPGGLVVVTAVAQFWPLNCPHTVGVAPKKTHQYRGYNAQQNKQNYHCCMLHVKVVKRDNSRHSPHKKELWGGGTSFALYLFEMMDVHSAVITAAITS